MPHERNYSDQTSELLGKMPSWILRWGMAVIFVIFTGFLLGSYFIKYPQIVTAPITLTTLNPPADLIAKSSGRIDSLFVADGRELAQGDTVALLQNTANYADVVAVERWLHQFVLDGANGWLDRDYAMGELQGGFSEFRQQVRNYLHYTTVDHTTKKKRLLEGQIVLYRKSLTQKSTEASSVATELSVLQLEQQLLELAFQHDNKVEAFRTQIVESRTRLGAQILQWQQNYLLLSPTAGRVSYAKRWSRNQTMVEGEKLATVVPKDSTEVVGMMQVPSAGFGRVAVGQTVHVKLNGYPYYEYGRLRGRVVRVSSVPDKEGYVVEVAFPDGLQSTYKEQLRLIQQMDGTGEIVTRDQRLIERFIQPLRALFDKVS